MRHTTPIRLTLLSQCILLSLTAISGSALAASSIAGTGDNSDPTISGLTLNAPSGYHYDDSSYDATVTGGTLQYNIYMTDDPTNTNNNLDETRSLTINGTDMHGQYIQAESNGTANVTLENGASADMIEAGNNGEATNVNINVDGSTLKGQNSEGNYNDNDKSYMYGSAIYIAPGDTGTHAINVTNHSELDGSIVTGGSGAQSINLSDSKISDGGIYAGSSAADTTISLTNNSTLDATNSEIANDLGKVLNILSKSPKIDINTIDINTEEFDDLAIAVYGNTKLSISDHSSVTGDIALFNGNGAGNTIVSLTNGSTVTGDLTIEGSSSNQITLNNSTLLGNIDTSKDDSGDTTITMDNNAVVDGNISTGAGNDTVTLTNSTVTGDVDGGAGTDTLSMDASSTIGGQISNFETVNTAGSDAITTKTIADDTTWNINNGSTLHVTGTTGDGVQVNMSSDSTAALGDVTGDDSLVVTSTSLSTANQQNVAIATYNTADTSSDAVSVAFSNGSQQVESRSGAYNYDDALTDQTQAAATDGLQDDSTNGTQHTVLFSSSRRELASDVQGVIAGLDAAKQAGRLITDDLANRLNQVHLQNLYGHTADGAQVWGDFLYQNGDYSDDVDYKDITQGVQGGVDWTSHLNNGDSLTGGIALGWTRSRDRSTNGGSNNFSDSVYGNYYSVYGGWQQSLHDNLWGMFVDGSFSYGDMRYSTSANNVSNATTGMTQALSGSSDGDLYTTQARTGVNVLLPGETVLQPYATLGWDKAQENGFSDQDITFGDSQVSEWNTGFGMRVTTKLADLNKNVELYPWLDARYQTEFSDNTDIKAADYHGTDGHNATMGIFGAGINTTIGNDFSLNTGVYFGTGDVDNDASVQAGISYRF